MLSLVLFILILGTIVLIHELGHFIFAKIFNVYVYEYSIGMGSKIWSKKPKNSETEYCLRLIPFCVWIFSPFAITRSICSVFFS